MTIQWCETTLGEICDKVGGIIQTGPFGSQLHESDYSQEGTPVVMPKDIIEGRIVTDSVARIALEHVERLSRHKLKPGDIVYGRRGDIGRQALIRKEQDGWLCGTGCLRLSLSDTIIEPLFLHYYLRQESVIGWISNQAVGATLPNLNTGILRSVPVRVPPPSIQRRIGGILSAYDELIENNQRRIKILEEMARSLYREWFVHFRFPGHDTVKMVPSPLGPVPQGWEVKNVKEVLARRPAGQVYREEDVVLEGTVPVIDQSTNELLGFHDNEPDHLATPENPIAIFGDHTCKMQLLVEPFSIGPNMVAFEANIDRPISYLFHIVRSMVQTQEYKRHWSQLTAKEIVLADKSTTEHFATFIQPSLQQIEALRKASRVLRRTRDLLLPRLLSGHIEIQNADSQGDKGQH